MSDDTGDQPANRWHFHRRPRLSAVHKAASVRCAVTVGGSAIPVRSNVLLVARVKGNHRNATQVKAWLFVSASLFGRC